MVSPFLRNPKVGPSPTPHSFSVYVLSVFYVLVHGIYRSNTYLYLKYIDIIQLLNTQPLDTLQLLNTQPLDTLQLLNTQPLDTLKLLNTLPIDIMQLLDLVQSPPLMYLQLSH